MKFKKLHQQAKPLLIGNVWDVASAKIVEQLQFQALGTSSAAIAKMLGYPDGEAMRFEELAYIVGRIAANTKLPLSVDLEAGYSRDPMVIVQYIKQLADLGVVGINLEDSMIQEGHRLLLDSAIFSKTIAEIKRQLTKDGIDLFLNIRTDTFLLGQSGLIAETKKRIVAYEKAGADGIFLPCIEKEADIKIMVASTSLPINVIAMPNLPTFERLTALGVKRISMGNFIFESLHTDLYQKLQAIQQQQSFHPIFDYASNQPGKD